MHGDVAKTHLTTPSGEVYIHVTYLHARSSAEIVTVVPCVVPSGKERRSTVVLGYRVLHGYCQLAYEALAVLRPNYKIRLKMHIFHHMLHKLDQGSTLNPKYVACWTGEMWVGKMVKTSRGTHPVTTGCRVLQRWLVELLCFADQKISRAKQSRVE